ncbi:MAG: LPS export ABC transporter ATP-binding protein [bacterium]
MKLEALSLTKYFGEKCALDNVSIEVEEGEIVGLLGPNGSGKTTTFYSILGLIEPDKGKITIDSSDISSLPIYKRVRRGIGYLPQEPSIFESLTTRENLTIVLEFIEKDRVLREKEVFSLLSFLGLFPLSNQKAGTLSGGERRRLEIARVLSLHPKFILLDEPFLGVDPIRVSEIQEIIKNLKNKGFGILITDHNVRETLKITDRAYIIFEGKILLEGSSSDLVNNKEARRVYLGDSFEF